MYVPCHGFWILLAELVLGQGDLNIRSLFLPCIYSILLDFIREICGSSSAPLSIFSAECSADCSF